MKTILIIFVTFFLVAMATVVTDYIEHKRVMEERVEALEAEVQALRTEWIGYKAVLWERTEPFKDILPVAGGFVGVREEP